MKEILRVANKLFDFFGKGDLDLEEAKQQVDVLFVMGAHEATTTLAAAKLYREMPQNTHIVISGGGTGRGSWLLEQAVAAICLVKARPPLTSSEKTSEALMLERLLTDEGVPAAMIKTETAARHSKENWEYSLPFFVSLLNDSHLPEEAVIGVVQSPLNRRRAKLTGEIVLNESADARLARLRVRTIHFPRPDLDSLSERERVTEIYRLFGLRTKPESELRVCQGFCPGVIDEMDAEALGLKAEAQAAEQRWHALLEMSPRYIDYVRGALETMAPELGGIGGTGS